MKVLTEDCVVAKRIREVEQILRDKGISISYRSDGLLITLQPWSKEQQTSGRKEQQTFVILDGESGEILSEFPTEYDPTNIQKIENYISGE